ncbi:helix-turn-helix domain-containing protein [Haloferula helveola]
MEREAVELAAGFYLLLQKYLPPTTTLGELRVLTEVALGMYRAEPVCVTQVSERVGLTRWAVGRIIQRYIEAGMIREEKDPADSRRNLLVWTDDAFRANRDWSQDLLQLWQERGMGS